MNWGKAIDKVIFLWGPPLAADPANGFPNAFDNLHPDVQTAQQWCAGNSCVGNNGSYVGWEDLQTSCNPCPPNSNAKFYINFLPSFGNGNPAIQRVRFTTAVLFRFYANLQGNFGALGPVDPNTGTRCTLSNAGSSAWGLFVDQTAPGPVPPGGCGWQPGGSTYTRTVDPTAP